jgi:ParB family chromosome partitioning protein
LRLLQLSEKVQKLLSEDRLSAGHARALLALSDDVLRETIAKTIIEKELSVRETEKLIQSLNKKEKKTETKEKPSYIIEIESELEESLGTRVQIKPGAKKGIIEIEYYSNEDLERIMERVNK